MPVIIQNKRRATEYAVPAGGEILWYGIAADVPSGFAIDSYCANVFVRGCAAGAATNTAAGANSHTHTNPSATGSQADHTHALDGGSTGAASGTTDTFPTAIVSAAASSHAHNIPTGTSGSGGAHSHTLSAAALADAFPPYAQLYWIKAISESALPIGGVVMWDAAIAGKPSGFSLCNGTGTIDLRDKFVYGAASDTELGDTGGAETHVHGNADTGAAGTHTHSISMTSGGGGGSNVVSGYSGGELVSKGGHTHSLSGTSNADADHTHTMSNTGSGSSLPVYLKLYFIQRTA